MEPARTLKNNSFGLHDKKVLFFVLILQFAGTNFLTVHFRRRLCHKQCCIGDMKSMSPVSPGDALNRRFSAGDIPRGTALNRGQGRGLGGRGGEGKEGRRREERGGAMGRRKMDERGRESIVESYEYQYMLEIGK